MKRKILRALVAAAVALLIGVGLIATSAAPSAATDEATPYVYWISGDLRSIGRVGLDGSNLDPGFLSTPDQIDDLIVTATHIYWSNYTAGSIGRMSRGGGGVNQSFITDLVNPSSLAVANGRLYWAETGRSRIGRAYLDGTDVNRTFMTSMSAVTSLAASSTRLYWGSEFQNRIGVADINGLWFNPNSITGINRVRDLAVTGTHLYWHSAGLQSVGRADIDPSHVGGTNIRYMFVEGVREGAGLVVANDHLYWGNHFTDSIGRARVDGSDVNQYFIRNTSSPVGIAGYLPTSSSVGSPPSDGGSAGTPRATQRALNGCVRAPGRLPARGKVRVMTIPCGTNANRGVRVRVKTSPQRSRAAKPTLRVRATGPVRRHGVYIQTKGKPMRITIVWSAPATSTHAAFRTARTYRV